MILSQESILQRQLRGHIFYLMKVISIAMREVVGYGRPSGLTKGLDRKVTESIKARAVIWTQSNSRLLEKKKSTMMWQRGDRQSDLAHPMIRGNV